MRAKLISLFDNGIGRLEGKTSFFAQPLAIWPEISYIRLGYQTKETYNLINDKFLGMS